MGYIGVGLAVAGISMLSSYYWSRPKKTYLYEDGSIGRRRGNGSRGIAFWFSIFKFCIIAVLVLINSAHFFILISIGLGMLAGIALYFLLFLGARIITRKTKFTKSEFNKLSFIQTIIINLLTGAGFAILVFVWGWF